MLRGAVDAVVHNLQNFAPRIGGSGNLKQVVVPADREPDMPNHSRLTHLLQRVPELLVQKFLVSGRVELKNVEIIGVECLERCSHLIPYLSRVPVARAVQRAVKVVAELGGDDPCIPLPVNTLANEALREVVAVALRRIDEVDAFIPGSTENGVHLFRGKVHTPLAAKLPRTNADYADLQSCRSKGSIFHGRNYTPDTLAVSTTVKYYGRVTRIRHLFILILLSASAQLSADESAFPVEENGAGAPPALGLALAGGGALGFAHLGVILELEEIGLNPRYLAGTSIGSIVGALYAAGYTGEEMLEIVQSVEWDNLLFDQPRRSSLNVGAREATRRFRVGARFDDWKLVTPAGISAGQRATEYLDALLSPFAGIDDFFQLPRPIGIVATDLVSGEEVVYTGGDLKNAVRASIAVPGVFTPLHYDGRYLIDGGWTNNLPVDVVKGLGADVVIAVDLFNSKRQVGQLQDVGTIVEQAGIILRQERIEENLVLADVAISPDLTGYTTIDFEKALEMVEIGRQAARDHRDELILLRNRLEAAGAVQSLVPPTRGLGHRLAEEAMRDERFSVGAVHLSVPPDRETPQSLIDVRRSLMGRTFTAEELRTEIYRLYDSGGFEYVSYDLEAGSFSTRDDAYHVLTIYAVPEKQYRSEVQLGFGTRIQLDGALNTRSVLHGNHVATLGDGLFRLDTDLWLTEVAQFRTALSARVLGPLRLGIGGYVLAPPLIFYDGRTVEALYLQRRNGLELWLESPVLRRATLGVSGFTEWFGLDRVQGRETVDQVRTRRVGVGARFHLRYAGQGVFSRPGRRGVIRVSVAV